MEDAVDVQLVGEVALKGFERARAFKAVAVRESAAAFLGEPRTERLETLGYVSRLCPRASIGRSDFSWSPTRS